MQKGFNTVCIDANILIHATFEDFDKTKHLKSLKMLDSFADSGIITYVTPQILREFFAISTNSTIFKKPLSNKQAVKKIKEFLSRAVGLTLYIFARRQLRGVMKGPGALRAAK